MGSNNVDYLDCSIRLEKDSLIVENSEIKRVYEFNKGNLITHHILNKQSGFTWYSSKMVPDMNLPGNIKETSFVSFQTYVVEETLAKEKLLLIANGDSKLHARWAKRMMEKIDAGVEFEKSYPYPVQAWKLGNDLLLIGIGGEAVVDYSFRFKKEYNRQTTWVCGYANELVAYIPSRRVWEEGGYEGGPHLDEYGRPAWRWAGDVEDRIVEAVKRVVSTLE